MILSLFIAQFAMPIRVACIGDSITAGVGATHSLTLGYPAQLQAMLGAGYDVRSFGKPGAAMLHVGSRPIEFQPEIPSVYAFEPQVIVVMLGTNDANPPNWERGHDAFVPTYEHFIRDLQHISTRPRVLVGVPPPVFKWQSAERGKYLDSQVIPLVRQVARETGCALVDFRSALDGQEPLFPDGLHPNDAGHGLMAELAYESVVDPKLQKRKWKVVSVSSEEVDEGPAKNAIDGDPETYWHTRYSPKSDQPPHLLTVDTGSANWWSGFRYLPRQDGGVNGRVKGYGFEVSIDGRTWKSVADGNFNPGFEPDRVRFTAPIQSRYFRFTIKSEQSKGPFGSAGEIDVIPTPPNQIPLIATVKRVEKRNSKAAIKIGIRN